MKNIDELATFCKRKGFVYPTAEIYGGLAGFYDFGPYGVELKNNIKAEWWKTHVSQRSDITGIDGSIITNAKIWEASGHVNSFTDLLLDCKKCGNRLRADQLIEEKTGTNVEGRPIHEIKQIISEKKLKCPKCGSGFTEPKSFNLMFTTTVGPIGEGSSITYLRPETAQLIFADFKLVAENARLKLPFGIAQTGKAFRNEISPRDFLFRVREFEQMEIEYFIKPGQTCPFIEEFMNFTLNVLTKEMQKKKQETKKMKIKDLLAKELMIPWHAYWLAVEQKWFTDLGAKKENFRARQHLPEEKSHYAVDTWDLEYKFPFGWKELLGVANRTDFDLKQHTKHSGEELSFFDQETSTKIVPHVIAEPSLGVERAFLVFMLDAYEYDAKRENIVLKLHPKLAPIKAAVFPLVSNKPELVSLARKVYDDLKKEFSCKWDTAGSIGRRYFRADEEGTFLSCTIDFQSLEDNTLTLRNRDTTQQIRVKISELKDVIRKLIEGERFESCGRTIK